jgi:uncharacterized protein YqfA (UPF0365 family)
MENMLLASGTIWLWVLLAIVLFVVIIIFALVPVNTWIRCLVSGTHVGIFKLIGMRLRRVNVNMVVDAYINAKKAGLDITINDLETHAMAGGNVTSVVAALISAYSAKINLSLDVAKAIDLAGRDVLKAVKESVTPKVIKTPVISAVAKNGIELRVLAKVTVKTNLSKLVGGAGEETIISRVGEGIVTTIGSAETHQQVLENPDSISKVVLEKGLDAGTAFQILSIDIADIDVGNNIGAELKKSQAQAEKEIAQAKAEERKAMAIAQEQEMRARVQAMRANVVQSEAKVPEAIANAFNNGKLGVMDYYRLQNIQADTNMRNSLFGGTEKENVKQEPTAIGESDAEGNK